MLERLSLLFTPSMLAPEPTTASAHARKQLSAAVDRHVWRQAQGALNPTVASPSARLPVSPCPNSAEDALNDIYTICSSCLISYSSSGTGQEHAMQSLCAVHACCTTFMQLSLSTQMLSNAPQLQPDQAAPWSQLMATAQKFPTWLSAQTCWPHVMRLPASSQPTNASSADPDTDLDNVQALLSQTSIVLMETTHSGSFQNSMHYRLLDIAMLQAWCCLPAPIAATDRQQPVLHAAAASAGEQESAKKLAGFVPTLAKLLSHVVKMTDAHVMLALEQQLVEGDQLDKLDEVKAVMSMGLHCSQVCYCNLACLVADSLCLPCSCCFIQATAVSRVVCSTTCQILIMPLCTSCKDS